MLVIKFLFLPSFFPLWEFFFLLEFSFHVLFFLLVLWLCSLLKWGWKKFFIKGILFCFFRFNYFLSLPGQFLICFSWSLSCAGFLQMHYGLSLSIFKIRHWKTDWELVIDQDCWCQVLGLATVNWKFLMLTCRSVTAHFFKERKPHFFCTLFSFGQGRSGSMATMVGRIDYSTNRLS